MAKKKPEKRVTKSDFLRKALTRNADLELDQLNRRWAKAGHPGTISSALYYAIRRELGIRTVWAWVREGEPFPGEPAPVPTTDETYQFKITLMGAPRPIWRRIVVDDCSLDKLHEHIQTAMGWTNSHLHHFRLGETLYGDPMLMQENFGEMGYRDSTATPLSAILPRGKGKFRFAYEYDFGDGWEHLVEFEGRVTPGPRRAPPALPGGPGRLPARGRRRRLGLRRIPRSDRRPRPRGARIVRGVDRWQVQRRCLPPDGSDPADEARAAGLADRCDHRIAEGGEETMRVRWFGGPWPVLLIAGLVPALRPATATGADLDLTAARVLVPAGAEGPAAVAVDVLVEEVEARSRVAWPRSTGWPDGDGPVVVVVAGGRGRSAAGAPPCPRRPAGDRRARGVSPGRRSPRGAAGRLGPRPR